MSSSKPSTYYRGQLMRNAVLLANTLCCSHPSLTPAARLVLLSVLDEMLYHRSPPKFCFNPLFHQGAHHHSYCPALYFGPHLDLWHVSDQRQHPCHVLHIHHSQQPAGTVYLSSPLSAQETGTCNAGKANRWANVRFLPTKYWRDF